jgi:hypothetical protein
MNIAGGAVVNGEGPGGLSIAATQSNIGFYTNGAGAANERMRITSAGSIGIGTTTIGSTIQVNGNAAIGYSASTAAPTNGLAVSGNTTIGGTISASNLLSGTYTPTLTNNANITSSTAYACQYMRVGNVVTVSGEVDITATSAATLTQLILTLPISSNFPVSGFNYCGGTGYFQNGTAFATGYFRANQSATTVSLVYLTGATTPISQFYFSFTYQIV